MRRPLSVALALVLLGCNDGPVSVSFPGASKERGPRAQAPGVPASPQSQVLPADLSLPAGGRDGEHSAVPPVGETPAGGMLGGGGLAGQGATKLSATIRIEAGGQAKRGKIRLEIQVPRGDKQHGKGFKTQALDPGEIAYVDVTVSGIGLNSPIKGTDGLLPVPMDGRVTVDLEVPTGVNRVVTLGGYNGSQRLIEGSVIKGLLDVTPLAPASAEVSWRTQVSGLIMERLIQRDPLLASLVKGSDLQAQVDGVTQPSGTFPYAFVVHPSLLMPAKWADDILAANAHLPPGSTPVLPAPNGVTVVPGEISGVFDGLALGTAMELGAKDPASKALAVTVTGNPQSYRLSGVTPGTWPVWLKMNGQTLLRTVQVPEGGSVHLDWRAPVVVGLSPTHTAPGATVKLTGRNFGSQGHVLIGGQTATATSWSDSGLEVTMPGLSAGTADVVVRRDDLQGQAVSIGVLAGPPQLTRINPTTNSLSVPRSIVLTGNNYSPVAAENKVVMVSPGYTYVPDVTLVNSTNLAFSSPSVVGTYTVNVTIGGLTSNSYTYTVTP